MHLSNACSLMDRFPSSGLTLSAYVGRDAKLSPTVAHPLPGRNPIEETHDCHLTTNSHLTTTKETKYFGMTYTLPNPSCKTVRTGAQLAEVAASCLLSQALLTRKWLALVSPCAKNQQNFTIYNTMQSIQSIQAFCREQFLAVGKFAFPLSSASGQQTISLPSTPLAAR